VSELPEELRKSPLRVLRGSAAGDCKPARSALRDLAPYFETKSVAEAIGFRVARTMAVKQASDRPATPSDDPPLLNVRNF
jgi:hypothetical protein